MVREVKREPHDVADGSSSRIGSEEFGESNHGPEGVQNRRVLRSRYLAVKNFITDEREDITRADSDKFETIINEVDSLYQLVHKPREQVADAQALLNLTNTLVSSMKAYKSDGITPSDFVSCILRDFREQHGARGSPEDSGNSIAWKDVGVAVSHHFRGGPGCCTMIGPMDIERKNRKAVIRRKHMRPSDTARPAELGHGSREEGTDTDNNMLTMFNILRKNRVVRLEHLVLNRNSFAQTVENLFALSFLVKDGRAEIKLDETGCHLVSPRNAPAANAVLYREVAYSHFIFRFDFKDWKLMTCSVRVGDELMPSRNQADIVRNCQSQALESGESQASTSTTPIRKFSRNRGLVLQEQTLARHSPENDILVVEDSPQNESLQRRAPVLQKGKRKLN
ncbi:Non-structural maintenance of chromosomes element 4 [Quillaja saponaria]|uniref:Non-structural maintenance of chromosomes element 4 n=1 Tax=Quillaja saponaria TaxID=32244 RepID=A0AAD7VCY5_QUISA|nr:Non-structural maintenance of chromosomes element 4 [Quillaja saponaria]